MTLEIAILFGVIAAMVVLFLTEKLPIDLTAFLGLSVLTLAGYVTAEEAFSGFSSPAVITMLAMFVVSAALQHTGVADLIGVRIHRSVGNREAPLVAVIMLVAGALSAFMPNIAAAAVLMPAVASIARRAGLAPSRLFMPLSFGAILGGTTTLVGTAPNMVAGELLKNAGYEPFRLFEFTFVGLLLLAGGVLFMITIGRRLLPVRDLTHGRGEAKDLADVYQLQDRLFSIRVPADSRMDGRTLGELRLGNTLNVQVVAILRNGRRQLAPKAGTILRAGDVLLVEGLLRDVQELVRVRGLEVSRARVGDLPRPARGVTGVRARLKEGSALAGRSLRESGFRQRFGLVVVGVRRGKEVIRGNLGHVVLADNDEVLALGTRAKLKEFAENPDFEVRETGLSAVTQLEEHVYVVRIPDGSPLVGTTVGSSRIGELVGVTVSAVIREDETRLAVSPEEVIQAGDRLLVAGEPSRIVDLLELGEVHVDADSAPLEIESDEVGVVETTLAPRSMCLGKTLKDLSFRERYGLQVLAVWREGRPIRTKLAGLPLRLGDALLVQGARDKIRRLSLDPDFVVLLQSAPGRRRVRKAPVALGGLLLMIAMVVTGFQPVHVATFVAASLVILLGAVTMEEVYRSIEWRTIFVVAAVLPVGFALQRTGAAGLLSTTVADASGPLGPYAVLAALALLSSALSQALDGAPAVVLVAPMALQAASNLGLSPYPIMMGVSLGASAAFMTPFSHKSNLLVMGAGGYRAVDYLRTGTPLTFLYLAMIVALVPLFFPF